VSSRQPTAEGFFLSAGWRLGAIDVARDHAHLLARPGDGLSIVRTCRRWREAPVAKKAKAPAIVYPTCVRHTKPCKDVRLRHYFLCDPCAHRWTKEAFAESAPLYVGEKLVGYCLLCNNRP
jgi:hypothetical protein